MLTETIWLQRPRPDVPWGFRLQGGKDYQQPLTVYRVSPGSIASTGLTTGDIIMRIGDTDTSMLTFNQSQDIIKQCGNLLQFQIAKQNGPKHPGVAPPNNQQFSTKLDEQLAKGTGAHNPYSNYQPQPSQQAPSHPGYGRTNSQPYSPTSPGNPPFSPTGSQGPSYGSPASHPHPGAPDYNYTRQGSHPGQSSPYGGSQPYGTSPQAYSPAGQSYGDPYSPPSHSSGPGGPQVPQSPSHTVPDAVLNMAARGAPDKKPWAYVPDANALREHRDKVRRRPGGNLPRYQQMMNMPSFDDSGARPGSRGGSQRTPSAEPAEGPDGMVVHAQYNSPLNVYSDNSMVDTFAAQTGGQMQIQRPGGKKPDTDITQSETYKMIHGIDQPRAAPQRGHSSEGQHRPMHRQPSHDDEVSFSGVQGRDDIPSKSFQRLQQMQGSGGVDESSILGRDDVGDYSEESIRYRGQKIPSRSFAMLQKMTGSDGDGGLENSYPPPPDGSDPHEQALERRRRRRRSRSRQRAPPGSQPPPSGQEANGFDENAYLSGKVPIVRAPGDSPRRPPRAPQKEQSPSWQKPEEPEPERDFDEKAYLSGKVGIFGDAPQHSEWKPKPVEVEEPEWKTLVRKRRESQEAPFNEQMIINLKPCTGTNEGSTSPEWKRMVDQKRRSSAPFDESTILGGQQKKPSPQDAPWSDRMEANPAEEFDEHAYLAGKIPIMGNEPVPTPYGARKVAAVADPCDFPHGQANTNVPEPDKPFDERAYLMGRIPLISGGEPDLRPLPKPKRRRPQEPSKPKLDQPFEEGAFLAGRIRVLGGSMDNLAKPPRGDKTDMPKELAPWERTEDEEMDRAMTDDEFDEDSFLRGGYPAMRQSVDRELPPRQAKPKKYRERAPWEVANNDEPDYGPESDAEFDEDLYLKGRLPIGGVASRDALPKGKDTFQKVRSRAMNRLARSMSRDSSPNPEEFVNNNPRPNQNARNRRTRSEERTLDDDSDMDGQNIAYNDLMYVGKKIPSKTFNRLQGDIQKNATIEKDPLERLRGPKKSAPPGAPEEPIDLDAAMEKLNLSRSSPTEYLDILRQSCEGGHGRVEFEDDETDF